jgi:DNA helicase IV
LLAAFQADFLSADNVFARHPDRRLLSRSAYRDLKAEFIQRWSQEVLGEKLDEDQAAAVAEFGGDVRVIARAGSGKTRTLVTRALFLSKHCRVDPRSLLVLAFNKRAADEMLDRLSAALIGQLPHVMTFHALAYALVHPEETLVFDDPRSEGLALSRVVQDVIDEHIRDPEVGGRIRAIMLQYFREDWEAIVAGGQNLGRDEMLEHRRALARETLRGEFVKSYGEKLIANVLFEHGIDYKYEPVRRWKHGIYRPDFVIAADDGRRGVAVEYFGLAGDPGYDQQADAKRAYWSQVEGWTLVELAPDTIARGADAVVQTLRAPVERLGIGWARRSEDDVWASVRDRAIDRFTSVVRTFVSRCRKSGRRVDEVDEMVASHSAATSAEAAFVEISASVHRGYVSRLWETGSEDFDGLMWEAIRRVDAGESRFVRERGREQGDLAHLRHVMVDEFQDFSEMFFASYRASERLPPMSSSSAWVTTGRRSTASRARSSASSKSSTGTSTVHGRSRSDGTTGHRRASSGLGTS